METNRASGCPYLPEAPVEGKVLVPQWEADAPDLIRTNFALLSGSTGPYFIECAQCKARFTKNVLISQLARHAVGHMPNAVGPPQSEGATYVAEAPAERRKQRAG